MSENMDIGARNALVSFFHLKNIPESEEYFKAKTAALRLTHEVGTGKEDASDFNHLIRDVLLDLQLAFSGPCPVDEKRALCRCTALCDAYSDYLDGDVPSFAYENEKSRSLNEQVLCETLIQVNQNSSDLALKIQDSGGEPSPGFSEKYKKALILKQEMYHSVRDQLQEILRWLSLETSPENKEKIIGLPEAEKIWDLVSDPEQASRMLSGILQRLEKDEKPVSEKKQ